MSSSVKLPVIDISLLRSSTQRESFLEDLRHAAHDAGFFYVVGHGVPQELTDDMFRLAREFFAKPTEEKLAIQNTNSPQFRGYTRTGTEITAGSPDWREQLDIGVEREALVTKSGDPAWKRLIGPNQWPDDPPELKKVTLAWQAEAFRVSCEVLRALAAALGQDEDYFDRWFGEDACRYQKVIHYPPGGSGQGVGSHKDYGYLALLQQDQVGGLQVEANDGTWIDAVPVPGSFVFNIGEMLEIATNGYLRATQHRVVSPNSGVDRYSIPFFLGPKLDTTVPPIDLPPSLAAKARGISQEKHNPLLASFGDNTVLGFVRSHPKVAQRYWADVTGNPHQIIS